MGHTSTNVISLLLNISSFVSPEYVIRPLGPVARLGHTHIRPYNTATLRCLTALPWRRTAGVERRLPVEEPSKAPMASFVHQPSVLTAFVMVSHPRKGWGRELLVVWPIGCLQSMDGSHKTYLVKKVRLLSSSKRLGSTLPLFQTFEVTRVPRLCGWPPGRWPLCCWTCWTCWQSPHF